MVSAAGDGAKIAQESGLAYYDAFALAMNDVLDEACRTLAIPKRITTLIRDIWQLQLRMSRRQGKRALEADGASEIPRRL